MYSAITRYIESSDSEIQLRQTGNNSTDFVCAAVTPVMKRVHASVKQATETVFCDRTSRLDQTNTSLTWASEGFFPRGGSSGFSQTFSRMGQKW